MNARADKGTLFIPADEEDTRDYGPGDDAATVTMTNLEEEIRQTAGLMVTVNKEIGGPNQPMGHCFKQVASNFPMLDDLKEYVQKHYGEGNYRAFYRVGNKIVYNIPFSVSKNLERGQPVVPTAGSGGTATGEIAQLLTYFRERDEALFQRLQGLTMPQQSPDAIGQIKSVLEVMAPFLPKPGAALTGTPADGLETYIKMKSLVMEELREAGLAPGKAEPAPWWAEFGKELVPALAGIASGFAEKMRQQRAAPSRDMSVVAETSALPHQPPAGGNTVNDPKQQAIASLASFAPHLGEIDKYAMMGVAAKVVAVQMVERTPDEHLLELAALAAPANRENSLGAVFHYVPAAEARREWWNTLMDEANRAIEEDLTAPPGPGDTSAG